MLSSLWLDMQRWWWRRGAVQEPLCTVLAAPYPGRSTPVHKVRIIAVDLELTGLDPHTDQIVSIGWVPIENGRVRLARAERVFVQIDGSVDHSATVHGIVDASLREAVPLRDAVEPLLQDMSESVLLAHHAPVETGFLNAACRSLFGAPLLVPVIDTVPLGRRLIERGTRSASDADLGLDAQRRRFHLPPYPAHDALTDAVATAELFLAHCARLDGSGGLPLSVVLR
ncbi:MAG: exonuclease domain-containing protein [Longimonas sp.]|uniref:exonuclease domain-containing protein n=1 Tax=Longimonas sp. TaxID=2039626 RepID=UPI003357BF5B